MVEIPKLTLEHMAKLEEIATLVGRINSAWGDAQFWLYSIFCELMAGDIMRAEAIFFALKTDRAQRDITAAVAKLMGRYVIPTTIIDELLALIERQNQLAGRRNEAIHTMWGFRNPNLEIGPIAGSSPRLASKPILETLNATHAEILELTFDLAKMHERIEHVPWPSLAKASLQGDLQEASSAESDPPHTQIGNQPPPQS